MRKQADDRSTTQTSNFSRNVAYALALSVVLLIGAVAFTAKWISNQHDLLAESNSFQVVETALTSLRDRTESLGYDYSNWDPYYEAVLSDDEEWLYSNAVGGELEEGADIELISQILPGHRLNQGWSIRHNDIVPTSGILDDDLMARMNAALDPTELNSRSVITSYEILDGEIWILAASRIIPWDGVDETVTDLEVPRQILGTRLTDEHLNAINDRFFLQGMNLSFDAPFHINFIELQSISGDSVGYVSWAPPTPGERILQQVPFVILAVVAFVIIILTIGTINLYKNAKKLEVALRRAQVANRHKDEFIATISHELRTPLTSVTASIKMLSLGMLGKLPEKAIEVLKVCERNNDILGSLIEDLLLIGAIDSGNFRIKSEQTELNYLLKTAVENFKGYADNQNVTIELTLEDQPLYASVDTRKMNQVIGNLLSNAAKFSAKGGIVRVAMEHDADKVRISVTDSGIGIPAGSHADVFGRFRQVDSSESRKHNGSGVGLSISMDIVNAHGGTLNYESELGVGTCFTVEIDRATESLNDNAATMKIEESRFVA